MFSLSAQPRILPGEQDVLNYLKQHIETEYIDPAVLEIVARSLSGQPFFRSTSLKGLKLSIKGIDVLNLESTLNRCAVGEKPVIRTARECCVQQQRFTAPQTANVSLGEELAQMTEERIREESEKKQLSQVLQEVAEKGVEDTLKIIKNISDLEFRKSVCLSAAKNFAEKGDFTSARQIVWAIKYYDARSDRWEQNAAFSKLAVVFAKHGYIREAQDCVSAITFYGKTDEPDSDYDLELRRETYRSIVEILIQQNQFKEARGLLYCLKSVDRNRLEKAIKEGLATSK